MGKKKFSIQNPYSIFENSKFCKLLSIVQFVRTIFMAKIEQKAAKFGKKSLFFLKNPKKIFNVGNDPWIDLKILKRCFEKMKIKNNQGLLA